MIGHYFFINNSWFKYSLILAAVLLVGCQTTQIVDQQPVDQDLEVERSAEPPNVDLNQDLLTQILTAEVAVRAGQFQQAVDQILPAARESSDPRLASKATYWALQSGLYEKATEAAQLWLKLLKGEPESHVTRARLALAGSYMELEQPEQGLAQYRQIISESGNKEIYKLIAGDLSRLSNVDESISTFQILVNEANDAENANVGLGILAARLNDFELSHQAIDQALVANPVNQDAALIKLSYLFENEDEQAIHNFAQNYLKQKPDGNRLRMEYARYLSNNAEASVAIRQFDKVAANDESLYEEATLNIIALAMQEEDYALADEKLALLLDKNPTDDRLTLYRCQVQRELQNYDAASELCQEIVFGQYYFPAQLEIGNVLADQNQLDEALIYLDNIPVSGAQEQVRVYMRQQNLLYQADQLERAINILDKALTKYTDDTSLLYARGLILSELGKVSDHERDMRRLIMLEPENAHAYNALGYTLADLTSRYDEALGLIKKAIELDPDDAYILDSLGWVYFKLNELDKAKIHLEQAFELSEDAEIAAHLGELYWTLGDKTKAKSIWNKARKQTPDNKVLNRTLERFL